MQTLDLSILKAQIHPHFLLNILHNLYALTMNKSDNASSVVMGLSQILRYILYDCNYPEVNLGIEMGVIERYISLERIGYKERLEINLNLQGNLVDYAIAPLLIFTTFENAFKHGVGKLELDSWIKIDASIHTGNFVFKLSNNKPCTKLSNQKKSKYGNIGLSNIKRRLRILYPKTHAIKIINDDELFMVY